MLCYVMLCYVMLCYVTKSFQKYENCSCIVSQSRQVPVLTEGSCDTSCNLLYVFLIVLFLLAFLTMAGEVPAEQAVLR